MIVSCGVIVKNGKILMVKKGGEPFKSTWCPPGGKQKDNELPEETCKREMKEEVNLKVKVTKKLIYIDYRELGKETARFAEKFGLDGIYFYLCEAMTNLNKIKYNSDASNVKWLSKEEALKEDLTPAARVFLNRVNI
jgi:ADP-ribose pyrophosphatase YjhB (NUDIX family)